MNRKDFEIMAPVGSWESLYAAHQGGADAIYFGIEGLNMRSRSSVNFTLDDLRTIAEWCHEHGMKSYLTVNTIVYDEDMDYMRQIVTAARDAQVSAIIASDMATILFARSIGVEVHISTQVNCPLHRRGGAHFHPGQREQQRSRALLQPVGRRHGTGP